MEIINMCHANCRFAKLELDFENETATRICGVKGIEVPMEGCCTSWEERFLDTDKNPAVIDYFENKDRSEFYI